MELKNLNKLYPLTDNENKTLSGGNDDHWIGGCPYQMAPEDNPNYGDGSPYYKFGTFLGNIALLGWSITAIGKFVK